MDLRNRKSCRTYFRTGTIKKIQSASCLHEFKCLLNIFKFLCNCFRNFFLAESEYQNLNVGGKQIQNLCQCCFGNKYDLSTTSRRKKPSQKAQKLMDVMERQPEKE